MIDTKYLTAGQWCGFMVPVLSPYGTPPILESDEGWPNWARVVIQFPAIAACDPPVPREYNNWNEWADRFNQTIWTLTG